MLRRIASATAVAALLVGGLTACSTSQNTADDCEAVLQPGVLSDGAEVTGAFGEQPSVKVPKGLTISTTQRTIDASDAEAGGERADEGTLVGIDMAFFDASTGESLYEGAGFQGGPHEFLLVSADQANPLSEAVRCAAPGDRVVLGLAPNDAMQLVGQIGGTPGESMVGVLDVVSVSELSAQGKDRALPAGFPSVVTNDEGRPGVVLPPNAAPRGTTSAVRIEGTGPEVTADQNVIAQVLEVGWDGTELNNTWTSGPTALQSTDQIPATGNTFREALTGKRIGSQIVVIENDGAEARVVVVDILGVS
ncbi:peptidylprolyl isomerase [Leucobacter sp. gxy201]|uniref:peptidylprolyl isomerase n=1 Tax=Leucobacter sp. gxy201 TaxID=2957200 RepID=UPI003DA0A424